MIVDRLENLGRYASVVPQIPNIEAYLSGADLNGMKAGKYAMPDSDLFHYCFEYRTQPAAECAGEAHVQYIDVHLIASGTETVGVLDGSADVLHPYDAVSDYRKAEGRYRYVDLNAGDFVIFFQHEGHMTGGFRPGVPEGAVKRLVFKLPYTLP